MRTRYAVAAFLVALGVLMVDRAAGISLEIRSAVGAPGEEISFDVVLHTAGELVAGVQNDITFDPDAPVRATAGNHPACEVEPGIDKGGSIIDWMPRNCDWSGGCGRLRAIVFAFDNVDPIPDGSVLYRCHVVIPEHASLVDAYALICTNALASTPMGDPLAVDCSFGEILLPDAVPLPPQSTPPTHRPPPTRTPTSTWDPRLPTYTPSGEYHGEYHAAGGGEPPAASNAAAQHGCQIDSPTRISRWLLLALALALVAASRTRRHLGGPNNVIEPTLKGSAAHDERSRATG